MKWEDRIDTHNRIDKLLDKHEALITKMAEKKKRRFSHIIEDLLESDLEELEEEWEGVL